MTRWKHFTEANEGQLMYLACLLDTEGHFGWSRARGRLTRDYPFIQLVMAEESKDIMARAGLLMGKAVAGPIRDTEARRNGRHQAIYRIVITGWPALDIIQAVLPWLGDRKAAIAIELIGGYSDAQRRDGRTHCKHGHELTPENTYVYPQSRGRQCATCRRGWSRARYHAQKEKIDGS